MVEWRLWDGTEIRNNLKIKALQIRKRDDKDAKFENEKASQIKEEEIKRTESIGKKEKKKFCQEAKGEREELSKSCL